MFPSWFLVAALSVWLFAGFAPAAESPGPNVSAPAQIARGKLLYFQHCVICHQSSGLGSPGVFPPLAESDFLLANKKRSILALVQGLDGSIQVNGKSYDGAMPPATLDDAKVADVLTYVRSSFGNHGEAVTAAEVKEVRSNSRFPTYALLVQANAFAPLPRPPTGFALREVVRLTEPVTRLASDGMGKVLYLLGQRGDVWHLETATGKMKQVLRHDEYIDRERGDASTVGLALDGQKRLYIVVDQRNERGVLVTNEVTVYRTTATREGDPAQPKPWFQTTYPWGIGPFNHGVGHIAIGPDGYVYVSSGSRTDGNEAGQDPRYFRGGEVSLTACLWRLDPHAATPALEVFARGLRNAYGFCWNERGELFATDNGPDADAPEELNFIERGRHYGFPYQFSDWTHKPYAHTPDPPVDVQFTQPIANFGPAGGGDAARPLYTFDPHSSPAGVVFLGEDFPVEHRGTFLVARFGNLLKKPTSTGFDLLQMRLRKDSQGKYEATTTTLLAPLGRPIDVHLGAHGKIFICEYTRQTNYNAELGMLPGRILELSVKR
jgi:glucose/arabinose dehydrogenase/mono/diheme cytochrome c family protein